ncbi:hypothetical protein ACFL27_01825 [candidate division CSSED10-310 bacterium]|uniref:C2H2-type domain-containing protein n=1 Tax=candidate division CSSED10-310 bacterium TaxID=2855610 RepID=A0ABV6YRU6_UNCC1
MFAMANQEKIAESNTKKVGTPLIPIFVNCPFCGQELMDKDKKIDSLPAIHLHAHQGQDEGPIWLSAQYGSFVSIDNMSIPDGEITKFSCPFCKRILPSRRHCDLCQASLLILNLTSGGAIEFCSRKGCKNHYLEFQEVEALTHFYDMLHLDYSPAP